MQIGIVGLPYTGKTTIFNALTGLSAPTGRYSESQGEFNRGMVAVPDERVDRLTEIYKPRKTTYASIEFCDVAGFKKGAGSDAGLSAYLLGQLRDMDALAMVIRIFERDSVPHPDNRIDPVADMETLLTELNLADLAVTEKRFQRIGEQLKKGTQEERDKLAHEKHLLERVIATLNEGHPLRTFELSHEEQLLLKGFGFLSQKPVLILANASDFTSDVEQKRLELLEARCKELNLEMLAISGDVEAALREIQDPAEQTELMEAMGITERAARVVVQAAYKVTHSATFLTAGDPEVRAWTIPEGCKALDAADKIHSDISRGFIRAEVVPYHHLIEAGSIAKAREAGHYREEGKDAIIHDGDVVYFRFNV